MPPAAGRPPVRRSVPGFPEEEPFEDAVIAGRHPVLEALRAGRSLQKLFVAQGVRRGPLGPLLAAAREQGVAVQEVPRDRLDHLAQGAAHQGVVALAAAWSYRELEELLATQGPHRLLLFCDHLQDPQNLGALLRTAEACGAVGVVITARRSVGLSTAVAKASAGAIEHVPVARVTNLAAALEQAKRAGFWTVGADMDGEHLPWEVDLAGRVALVVGAEGGGLGRLVRERCDLRVRLPMLGQVGSLNASVAGSLLMYEALRQRLAAGHPAPKPDK